MALWCRQCPVDGFEFNNELVLFRLCDMMWSRSLPYDLTATSPTQEHATIAALVSFAVVIRAVRMPPLVRRLTLLWIALQSSQFVDF